MKKILYLLPILFLFSCGEDAQVEDVEKKVEAALVEGSWLMEFHLSETNTIPVNFNVSKTDSSYQIEFTNAEEKILAKDVIIDGENITINDPIFNTWFEGKIVNPATIEGNWFKNGRDYSIAFKAIHAEGPRFKKPDNLGESDANISGKWEVDFSKDNEEDHYKAIGQFQQVDDYVTGTFMTETGDYRFLEGNMYNNNLYLSCYDGSHLFMFKATLTNGKLSGVFWSGTHWEEPWIAERNDEFELTHPDSLTYLKEGYSELAFTFPDINGNEVSLTDEKYKGKVVIVNIMGPWCPNCKDETDYLVDLYDANHDLGLEIIALSFDKSDDFEVAKSNLIKIKDYFDARYDFLIAGKANKISAAKSLPMLNHVMSYPTTIFIDRNGKIRKIRTGFYGPGTGAHYTKYVQETNHLVSSLIAESEE